MPARMTPVAVAPQERGLEPLDQLLDLRTHERVDVTLLVGVLGMAPVEQRVVTAERMAAPPHRGGQLGGDVALRAELHRRTGRERRVPPAEPVVVLGHVHQVAHTRVVEQLCVVVGVEALERQLRDEVVEGSPAGSARDATRLLRAAGTWGARPCRAWSRGTPSTSLRTRVRVRTPGPWRCWRARTCRNGTRRTSRGRYRGLHARQSALPSPPYVEARRPGRHHEPKGPSRLLRARFLRVRGGAEGPRGEVDPQRPCEPPGRLRPHRRRRGLAVRHARVALRVLPRASSIRSGPGNCCCTTRRSSSSSRALEDRGTTLVPLRVYFKDGRAKVELATARGKARYDKRQAIAKRDAERETQRALKGDRE